ncbi:HlyD family efflux transporter periplasmic adaptor subunit [Shewanella submarina]|uniref:HlyD family secretion protein n=1 Tax=Shewanella submarina TaxID=2016376 RepID=A0ABV7GJX4_9GAMM|nr:biotin/lipoyl-binding protein [Shewanella submarina]MCL1038150.1 HlyD family efflux transporter periplasmic adaptor subunit [Shewanella submarina]
MKVVYQSSPKSTQPAVDKGQQIKYAQAKRTGYKLRWYLLLAMVIAPALLVIWFMSKPLLFISAPGLITTEPMPIRTPLSGNIQTLEVKVGQPVKQGQTLISISQAANQAVIADLEQRRHQLDTLNSEEEQAVIAQLQKKVDVAREGLKKQGKLLKDFNKYMEQKLIPVSDTIATVRYYTEAEMDLEQARADLLSELQKQKIEKYTGPLAKLKAEYDLELTKLKAQANQLNIRSPDNARVTQVEVQKGEYVGADTTLMWLQGRSAPVVIAYLDPKYLDYVHLGQQASIILPNGDKFTAEIKEPTELVSKLPKQLSGPFDGEQAVMKVILTPSEPLKVNIEGMPVKVEFDYLWLADLKNKLAKSPTTSL